MRLSAQTDIGLTRSENQDDYRAAVQTDGSAWIVVCDGMGGANGGATASALAVNCVEELLKEVMFSQCKVQEIVTLEQKAALQANAVLCAQSKEDSSLTGMGTTMVIAVAIKDHCILTHVGDSRAYLYRAGALRQMTRDHSVVQEMVEQGLISPKEAAIHPRKNVITRAVGISDSLEPESVDFLLESGDMLLVCTDGLTNAISQDDLVRLMKDTPFYEIVPAMIALTLKNGTKDNATAVLLDIE